MSETETKTPKTQEPPILVSRQKAAELFSVSLRTIDSLVYKKILKPRRIGGRRRGRVLFVRAELEQIARGNRLK